MNRLLMAFEFLTVLPVHRLGNRRGEVEDYGAALGRAMAVFPVVGAVQGAILVGADMVLQSFLPVAVASALLLPILLFTNNGFHIDGFADTVDGIAGGNTKEDRLRIMRKGDIGPTGVVALVLLLIVKFAAILSLPEAARLALLFLFPVFGRWSAVPMSYLSNYAREGEGLGKAFSRVSTGTLFIATLLLLLCALPLLKLYAFVFVGVVLASTLILCAYFKRKVGGVTGDIFGFQSEFSEALFLVAALALAPMAF